MPGIIMVTSQIDVHAREGRKKDLFRVGIIITTTTNQAASTPRYRNLEHTTTTDTRTDVTTVIAITHTINRAHD